MEWGSTSVCAAAIESRACLLGVMSARYDSTGLATYVRFPPIAPEFLYRSNPPLRATRGVSKCSNMGCRSKTTRSPRRRVAAARLAAQCRSLSRS